MDNNSGQVILVKDIFTGTDDFGGNIPNSSFPSEFTIVGNKLYFIANDGETGEELWVTDGTESGTTLVTDINPENVSYIDYPSGLTEFNGKLYFSANDGENGNELWISDGTAEGTALAVDINPGSNSSNDFRIDITELNGKLYFSANDGENGDELWVSDGTAEGTNLVKDINANDGYFSNSSFPDDLTTIGDRIYFTANDGETGNELWVSDGTAEGTNLLKDINANRNFFDSFGGDEFVEFNGKVYFAANNGGGGLEAGENGIELWVTDGTTEGTELLADIKPDSEFAGEYGDFYSDSNPDNFTEFNGQLYFSADDGENGKELWVTDGTTEGTRLFIDLNPGREDSILNFNGFVEFNNKLYFAADGGANGRGLWVTDGTVEGTELAAEIDIGGGTIAEFNNELYFAAGNGETGTELFKFTFDDSVDPGDSINVINGTNFAESIFGTDGNDEINGFDGEDTIDGGSGNDTLVGNNRRDVLIGGAGDDSLLGGSGDDTLDGGLGNDILTGSGNDLFVIREGDGQDIITDFRLGSDKLGLAGGITYDDLTLEGNTVQLGNETLVILRNVNTENLRISDVEIF